MIVKRIDFREWNELNEMSDSIICWLWVIAFAISFTHLITFYLLSSINSIIPGSVAEREGND